jgi:hypothetical protein
MEQIGGEVSANTILKEKAIAAVRLFEKMAEMRDISLQIRKKVKP